ncbi:MAG: hypothetical protein M1399_01205 [Actinobacteria bacterium]|nr:hypothetical protein [Actinomycetota bacterium]MCL5446789.1 hypothetical protein [Actinomycetota bacterium]
MKMFVSGGSDVAHEGRKARLLIPSLLALLALVASACSSNTPSTTSQASHPTTIHESMTILTGGMISHKGWPKFSPADLAIPSNTTVVLTIYNYDNGTAPLSAGSLFDKVEGGTETVNGSPVTSIPNANISHTFTVASLQLNVPIPAAPSTTGPGGESEPAVVTFTFHVTKAGTYTWQCEAPCGTGPTGMGGPMVTPGYMTGSLTVQ